MHYCIFCCIRGDAMEIQKGLIIIRGIEGAYKKLQDLLYGPKNDYKPPFKVPESVIKTPEIEPSMKLAMNFAERYRAELALVDESMIIMHSEIATMPEIEKDVRELNKLYGTVLEVETRAIKLETNAIEGVPEEIHDDMFWRNFAHVGWS